MRRPRVAWPDCGPLRIGSRPSSAPSAGWTRRSWANALATDLEQAGQTLAAALGNLGTEVAGLAADIDRAAAGLAGTDRSLAAEAPR